MRFGLSTGGRLEFGEQATATLNAFAQHHGDASEAGGILLGRMIENSNDVVIDRVSTPGPRDRRRRHFFFRSRKRTQEIVDAAWVESNATTNYLGEWHTHPEETPSPSCIDKTNWIRIALNAKYETPLLVFVIVGTRDIRVWELVAGLRKPTLLKPC
jgi:integrative and conjugative element protein (TIGR02256 family)